MILRSRIGCRFMTRFFSALVLCCAGMVVSEAQEITFRLHGSDVVPGGSVRVPCTVTSDAPIRAFTMVVDFDETVLQVAELETVFVVPEEFNEVYVYRDVDHTNNWGFHFAGFDNARPNPETGTTGGVIKTAGVLSFQDFVTLPVGLETEVFAFHFDVFEDAPVGDTEVRFEDFLVMEGSDRQGRNSVAIGADPVSVEFPSLDQFPVTVNARVGVVGDVSFFRRGDANLDGALDISDPVATLNALYLGTGPLPCEDAADANDDGIVDLSDPIRTLGVLFSDAEPLPPPVSAGTDPSPDTLGCAVSLSL